MEKQGIRSEYLMKIAVVTGASSGLGKEFVLQIAEKEKNLDEIWVIARRREHLEALQQDCAVPLHILAMDLTEEDAADRLEQELKAEKPEIGILVNGAGFGKIGSWQDVARRESSAMIRLNCQAAVEVTLVCMVHRLTAKFLPSDIMMAIWELIRRL